MSNEISPLSAVQDKIKDRIKSEFVNLIPDDMWSAMVQSVIADFTNDSRVDSYGRKTDQPSPVKAMIRKEIDALANAAIKAELEKLTQGSWNNMGEQVVGAAMKKLVAEHFSTILADVQKGIVESAVSVTLMQMRNGMMR